MKSLALTLSRYFLTMFMRDRQAMFFSLFFPIIFMVVFGFLNNDEPDPIAIGITNNNNEAFANQFINSLTANPLIELTRGEEESLREALIIGDQSMVVVMPDHFDTDASATQSTTQLKVLVDAAQARQLGSIIPVLEQALLDVERDIRNTEPMFSFEIEDVEARNQRYIDFLLPGLLAFTLMQICVAGSGFNIVEYRRKGILKRLFVTPIRPKDFIFGIVTARGIYCLVQLSVLLIIAMLLMDITVEGNILSLYLILAMGTAIFLSLGFCVGGFAKSQQTVMMIGNIVIFPQIFLSGVFYSIDSLPGFIQPLASLLPLSFLVSALREIVNNGLGLVEIMPDIIGLIVWGIITLALAIKLFVWKDIAT